MGRSLLRLVACSFLLLVVPSAAHAASGQALEGTFKLTAGACGPAVSGSYFRMIQPGGSAAAGPYVQNTDSSCGDKTYTPLAPGSDGGLVTGTYQAAPDPPFDSTGGGKAARITTPTKFYGVNFATATNATDPQTGVKVAAPRLTVGGDGKLSGDVRAFAASWNNQHFNQGAPKPDGSTPGTTSGPTGTYDGSSGHYTLEWTSQIVGGPFNNFTGQWHFEGTFVSSSSSSSSAAPVSTSPSPTTTAAPSTTSAPARSRAAAVSSSAPASTPVAAAVAPAATPGLARTGPSFPALVGVVVLVGALGSLYGARSLRRRA